MRNSVTTPDFYRAGIRTGIYGIVGLLLSMSLTACGGDSGGGTTTPSYTVSATAGTGGSVSPASATVNQGATASVTVSPDSFYSITGVSGCGGTLSGNTYTTGAITAACTVEASFTVNSYTVSTTAGTGGSISPASADVNHGATTSVTVTPDLGYNIAGVTGCDGTLSGNIYTTGVITTACAVEASFSLNSVSSYTVSATAGTGGSVSPASADVDHGATTSVTVTPDTGYSLVGVSGCDGTLSGNTYTTGAITTACAVEASFTLNSYTVSATAGSGGSVSPASATVNHGSTTSVTVSPDLGYSIAEVTGCAGTLSGNTYTTGAITAACTVTASFSAPVLSLTPQSVKSFAFSWSDVSGETEYRLLENSDGVSGYTLVATLDADATSHVLEVFLPARINASYMLRACHSEVCADSAEVFVSGSLAGAVGYVKASNTNTDGGFGISVVLSADGNTLAVGANGEGSNATGIDGDQGNNDAPYSGAVYVFSRSTSGWSQQAYVKASNTEADDIFGASIALAADGNTLAVGAYGEDSNAIGVNGDEADNSLLASGAVYVFSRSGTAWSQQAYVKASNVEAGDAFGGSVALAADGNTLAVGAYGEGGNGIGGETNNDASGSGAVYVFSRSGTAWSQQAYVKASNVEAGDAFGGSVALAADGNMLAVGAFNENSNATGIDGDEANNLADYSGAVYLFSRSGTTWSQQAYVKASNTEAWDRFGSRVVLAADGNTLAVRANWEASNATGINGDEANNSAVGSGAVYLFSRSGTTWSQQAYVKASNTEAGDIFGASIALSADGNTLAVGANGEGGNATGIGGDQADNSADSSGAVYLFRRSGTSWSQQAYVKASNTEAIDLFGNSVALSADGSTLAVGANGEGGSATGIGGDQDDNSADYSGAVYLY